MLCLRAVTGVDVEPDLVHMEIQDIGGGKGAHVFIEQCISIQFYIPYQTTANKGRWDVLGLQFASFKKTLSEKFLLAELFCKACVFVCVKETRCTDANCCTELYHNQASEG